MLLIRPVMFYSVDPTSSHPCTTSCTHSGQEYGPYSALLPASLIIMYAHTSLLLELCYCSCDNLWMQARQVCRQTSLTLFLIRSVIIAGKSWQVFEHVSCYLRPEDRQMCSNVYLNFFPSMLIDLMIDITFFLQFLPFLIFF